MTPYMSDDGSYNEKKKTSKTDILFLRKCHALLH